MHIATDEDYYRQREEQELLLALSAPSEVERKIHYTLASTYRTMIESAEAVEVEHTHDRRAN